MKKLIFLEKQQIPVIQQPLEIQNNQPFPYNMQPYSRIISRKFQYNFKNKFEIDMQNQIKDIQ